MKRRSNAQAGGLDLIEQAVHALRFALPSTLLCYYVGAAPFVLGALFFWSEMSRSGLAEQHLVGGALGLTALFLWMKAWQSVFALKLSAQIANQPAPRLTVRALARAIATQTFLHATGLVLIPIAAQLLVPTVWVVGFYQNATVLGLREPALGALTRRAWKQACFAVSQGHTALVALSFFSVFVFLDVAILILGGPQLAKILLGIETNSTLSAASSFNTTFLAAAAGVTYLCVDPLFKAVFTLRCFYGESRATGEDLRVNLRSFQTPALAALVLLLALVSPLSSRAADTLKAPPPIPASQRGTELDRSIEQVLERPEYTWREPRAKTDRAAKDLEDSALWKRLRAWLKRFSEAIDNWMNKASGGSRSTLRTPGRFPFSAHGFIYILIAILIAVIGLLAWWIWRTRSRTAHAGMEATPAAPVPDLARDDVAGDELPVDGWTALALELLERGELRLAMRAFYLASLAHLAARNLVSIAKFKSNHEYERELARRSHALPEVGRTFAENVSVFDRVWYGRHDIDRESIQHFRLNVERIKEC